MRRLAATGAGTPRCGRLVRAGSDHYRDGLNTPAFFEMLPDVDGLSGLDVGCGEGHNTRLLAERGARITGIDISERFVRHAREAEVMRPLGIGYKLASAVDLPFGEASFDSATAFMSLMEIPEAECVLAEVFRVLKPGGFFQFSITHPSSTRHTARTSTTRRDTPTPSRSATTSAGGRERSKSGSSSLLPRRSAKDYRLSAPPFSCAP
jgi:ubiquinone/menaquinone biosynthesis C-methylase UbiE